MTLVVIILWCASLVGMGCALYIGQYIGAATMMMNLIVATIMLLERIEQ